MSLGSRVLPRLSRDPVQDSTAQLNTGPDRIVVLDTSTWWLTIRTEQTANLSDGGSGLAAVRSCVHVARGGHACSI